MNRRCRKWLVLIACVVACADSSVATNGTIEEKTDMFRERSEKVTSGEKATIVAVCALVIAGVSVAYWKYGLDDSGRRKVSRWLRSNVVSVQAPDESMPDEAEITYAEKNMRILFSSAQNTFIHRNGERMATSIDELGPGFGIGKHGALIYENIWVARVGADTQQTGELVVSMLRRPYRYAVLPVTGLSTRQEDARTTCVVALPVKENYPMLVMVAGPVVNDPQDFLKPWRIVRIKNSALVAQVENAIKDGQAFSVNIMKLTTNETEDKK